MESRRPPSAVPLLRTALPEVVYHHRHTSAKLDDRAITTHKFLGAVSEGLPAWADNIPAAARHSMKDGSRFGIIMLVV